MERTDLSDKPGYTDEGARLARLPEIIMLIESWLQSFPDVQSALTRMEAFNVPCAPVLTVEETVTHPHLVQRGTVRKVNDPIAGEFEIPGMPIKFVGEEANLPYQAPTLGQHNAEILKRVLGKSDAEVDALVAKKILHAKQI